MPGPAMSRPSPLAATLLALATMAPLTHAAEPAPAGALRWQCMQRSDAQHSVACLPTWAMAGRADMSLVATPSRPGPEMRPVAERGAAEVFSADAWIVPLHAAPTDPARVAALLQSVLCGRQPDCRVSYGGVGVEVAAAPR